MRTMDILFELLALCEGNPPVTGGFPSQGPVIQRAFPCNDVIPNICPPASYLILYGPSCPTSSSKLKVTNTLGTGDAIWHQNYWSILVQHLFGAKSLPQSMLTQLTRPPGNKISVIWMKYKHYVSSKCNWKCRLQIGSYFVQAPMS